MSGAAPAALQRCVGDTAAFARLWGSAPHLHHGPPADDLLTIDDVDTLVCSSGLRLPAFRMVAGGRTLPRSAYTRRGRIGSVDVDDLVDAEKVHREFAAGATVVLQGLHRYWPPVTALCGELERELTHPVQANAYLTPAGSQGLRVHADAHDVFALQTSGRKQWVVHGEGPDRPATLDLTLAPGDCLYLPKGTAHAASTVSEPSLHLTLGVKALTWADALRPAVTAALGQHRLQAPLPLGFARAPAQLRARLADRLHELAAALTDADATALAEQVAQRFHTSRRPAAQGRLAQLAALGEVGDATWLRRREEVRAELAEDGDRVALVLPDREVRFPAAAAPVVRFVLDVPRLQPVELARWLDADSRLVVTRRLVREGLLTAETR